MGLREFVEERDIGAILCRVRRLASSARAYPPFCEPRRQGTHLPQDSLRRKRTA